MQLINRQSSLEINDNENTYQKNEQSIINDLGMQQNIGQTMNENEE